MSPPPAAATNLNVKWTEGIEDIQGRIAGVLPSLLRGLGLVCPTCKVEGEGIATGERSAAAKSASGDVLPCGRTCLGFLAEGCWNRAFLVLPCGGTLDNPRFWEFVFRVALPAVTHTSKIAAEVATMEWVRRNTDIPVPDMLAYASSRDNDVGYEWILMRKMPGVPYEDLEAAGSLTREQKVTIARTLADWQHSLSLHRFAAIGTPAFDGVDGTTPCALGPPATPRLSAAAAADGKPFPNLASLAAALIASHAQGEETTTPPSPLHDDHDDRLSTRLTALATPLLLRETPTAADATSPHSPPLLGPPTLLHSDINCANLLIDPATGPPTALLDWEHLYTLPLALGRRYPKLMSAWHERDVEVDCCGDNNGDGGGHNRDGDGEEDADDEEVERA